MIEPFITSPKLAAFLAASVVLAVVPGPGVVFLTAQTLSHGRRAGFACVAGVALGNFANSAFASVGLAALLAVSSTVFFVVKIAGAAYLVGLGVNALARKAPEAATNSRGDPQSTRRLRDGLIIALLNPKTTLFFAALLPQFIEPRAVSPLAESLTLAALFVSIAVCTDSVYVLTASALSAAVRGRRRRDLGRYAAGATLVALGIFAAFSDSRPAR